MAELYLKNSTGSTIEVADLGLVIEDSQSIPIDENDFDGYLTSDLISALNDNPSLGLVLSTTDLPDSSGDLPKAIAQERIQMKTHWKPSRDTFADLPSIGNEEGDIRLVIDEGVLYRWNNNTSSWEAITSTFSLTVTEIDNDPIGTDIDKLVFVQPEDSVYIDQTNNIAYIGPPEAPKSLDSQSLIISGTTLYTGRLSQSNVNYKSGDPAGSLVNYIIRDGVFVVNTPDTSERCDFGDEGTLVVYLNGTAIATADLAANFSESNREGNQDISSYNSQGTGDSMTSGVVGFVGSASGKGNLTILSVGMYNNFKFYQKWTARINFTDASIFRQGYNEIYLAHEGISPVQNSNKLDIFYDSDTGYDPSISVSPTITEDTPVYKNLSGVKFYTTGSSWDLDLAAIDCFDNVYHSSNAPLELYGWPGMSTTTIAYNDSHVSGVSSPPDIGETMTVSNWNLVQGPGGDSLDARITVRPRDPYGTYTAVQTPSDSIIISACSNNSTSLVEHFCDENYRLKNGSYDTIPSAITGQWDSTQSLSSYDSGNGLEVYNNELYFPTLDFSGTLPSGNPDYSSLASETNKIYIRAFKDTSASHSNGILRITGISKTQLYNRDIRVYIKAPTQTGWLDLTRDYNFATFTGADDDGCWVGRDVQTNSDFNFTLGTFGTEDSGYMIIVKIVYPDSSAPRVSLLEITNW